MTQPYCMQASFMRRESFKVRTSILACTGYNYDNVELSLFMYLDHSLGHYLMCMCARVTASFYNIIIMHAGADPGL